MRLSEKTKLVERITIKIKVFDSGKWEWKFKQRFIAEPRLQVDDFLKILDELKCEIAAGEGKILPATEPASKQSKKKNNKKKDTPV